jgi:group II intron reverse transcriptase/maturase
MTDGNECMGRYGYEYLKEYRKKGTKYYTLIDKVYEMDNLYGAWGKVKENRGSRGIDNMSIDQFGKNLDLNIRELHRLLKQDRYEPLPIRRVYIPKPDGKQRPLGIPAVRDRVIQQALLNVLTPVFEPTFMDCSYGFRPERSAHHAIAKVEEYRDAGCKWVVDADIQSYFDTIDHKLLMNFVTEEISDSRMLKLVEAFLRAGILEEGKLMDMNMGTPQGGVISPLLANIYLHRLDKEMMGKGYKIVRYADDFVVLCQSRKEAEAALEDVQTALGKLKLSINLQKTKISHFSEGIEFLGFKIFEEHKIPKDRGIKNYKDKIRSLTRRKQPIKPEELCKRVNPINTGWGNYFKIGNVKGLYRELDGWTRKRIRAFIEGKVSRNSNWQIPNAIIEEMGLKTLSSLIS